MNAETRRLVETMQRAIDICEGIRELPNGAAILEKCVYAPLQQRVGVEVMRNGDAVNLGFSADEIDYYLVLACDAKAESDRDPDHTPRSLATYKWMRSQIWEQVGFLRMRGCSDERIRALSRNHGGRDYYDVPFCNLKAFFDDLSLENAALLARLQAERGV